MVESLFHAQWLQVIWHDFSDIKNIDLEIWKGTILVSSHDHHFLQFSSLRCRRLPQVAWTSGCPRGGPKKNQPSQRSTRKNVRTPNHLGLVQSYGSGKGRPRTSCQLQEIESTLAKIFCSKQERIRLCLLLTFIYAFLFTNLTKRNDHHLLSYPSVLCGVFFYSGAIQVTKRPFLVLFCEFTAFARWFANWL